MNTELAKVHILVVNNDSGEVNDIKSWLEKDMRVPWVMSHCVNVDEARHRINKSDLILLKPEMEGLDSPKEVFRNIDDIAFEVPILVLTNAADEHGFSTFVMEQGAADTIIRGQFTRLVDAIEFALIRQRLTTGSRKATEKSISDNHDENRAENERHRQILRMFSGDYSVDP